VVLQNNKQKQQKDSIMKKLSTVTAMLATACLATPYVNANSILGIDVSVYQGTLSQANWNSIHGDGVSFAFSRAVTGYNYSQDATFPNNMIRGKAAGLQMGAYQFSHLYANTPAQEATYFWNYAGSKIIADGKSLDPMVDFEVFSGHDGASSYTAWFNAWSADVKAKTSAFMHPVLYASAGNGMCDLTTACTLSAWVANYNGGNLYTGNPWTCCTSCNYVDPGTHNDWTYWQVSDTGRITGISGNVDLDAYPLSLADLKAFQGVGQ
jgi:lysozyme